MTRYAMPNGICREYTEPKSRIRKPRPGLQQLVLSQSRNITHERVYVLDPKAPLALTPLDGDAGKFRSFLFSVPPPLFSAHTLSSPLLFNL